MQTITVEELQKLRTTQNDGLLVDVRTKEEFLQGHIPGALNIPFSELRVDDERFRRSQPVYVNCLGGGRSSMACSVLAGAGISAVNVEGGFEAWEAAKFAVEK